MPDVFFILQKKSDSHGQFSNMRYNMSHPHLYLARGRGGTETLIMSRVADYKPGTHIHINGAPLAGNSKYFVDDSFGPARAIAAAVLPPAAPPPPPGISIDKEIMVALTDVRLMGNFREAAGTIFYLPDGVLPKTAAPELKQGIREGSEITIVTDVPFDELEHYRTFLQQAYGFAKLRDVRLPGVVSGSTTITATHTCPKSAGYVSQAALEKALRSGP